MRRMLAIILGAAFTAAVFAIAPSPADHAAAQQPPPLVRIQLVIERVHVLDDKDALSAGELTYRLRRAVPPPTPSPSPLVPPVPTVRPGDPPRHQP